MFDYSGIFAPFCNAMGMLPDLIDEDRFRVYWQYA
jgi:hypothetical protein